MLARALYIVISTRMQAKLKRRKPNSRGRIISGADRLLRRNGYAGTALSDIAKEGDAPMGSVYFHFPGGKEQLAIEAMRYGSEGVANGLRDALANSTSPSVGLANCARKWADDLENSDWAEGCPVAATALQASTNSEPLRLTSVAILQEWREIISSHLMSYGCTHTEAEKTAEVAIALLEGAELAAKVQRSRKPLEYAAEMMEKLMPEKCKDQEHEHTA